MASRRIRVVVTSLERFLDRIMKKIALDIVANLVRAPSEGGTPVDTGWARANWIPNIGQPVSSPEGTREAVSNAGQQAGIATVVTGYRVASGRPIFISNNVPYIVFLNEGSSRQAPAGFVQRAIAKAVTEDLFSGLTGGT